MLKMEKKFLFTVVLAIFVISLSYVTASSVPYNGTINFNSGSNSIGVNVTGPGISINVTNDTTTPSNPTTTSGGGGAATNTFFASSETENSSNPTSPNFIPLSGMESPVNQTSTTPIESSGITGAVVGALTSTAGITTMAALFLLGIGTVGFFIIKKRK